MGCAGSKPHSIIPSATSLHHPHHHHVNSPQKGFILFNEKTIEYIKANENELRDIIKSRCEQKLFSNKTLKAKQAVAPTTSSAKVVINNNGADTETPKLPKKNGSVNENKTPSINETSILNSTLSHHEKEVRAPKRREPTPKA